MSFSPDWLSALPPSEIKAGSCPWPSRGGVSNTAWLVRTVICVRS